MANGWDSVLPVQGVWVQSLVGELRSYMRAAQPKDFKQKFKTAWATLISGCDGITGTTFTLMP